MTTARRLVARSWEVGRPAHYLVHGDSISTLGSIRTLLAVIKYYARPHSGTAPTYSREALFTSLLTEDWLPTAECCSRPI